MNEPPNRTIGGCEFHFVGTLEPVRNANGTVRRYTPSEKYANTPGYVLHKYGARPFCKFRLAGRTEAAGIYVYLVSGEVKYVGKTDRGLRSRIDGYASIQPRNCFTHNGVQGQETNCRVNSEICLTFEAGALIEVWFHESEQPQSIEDQLIELIQPPWNIRGRKRRAC